MNYFVLSIEDIKSLIPVEHVLPVTRFLIIVIGTILAAYLFRVVYKRSILSATKIVQNDPTSYKFISHVGSALIYIIGLSWAIFEIGTLRSVAQSLLATAGIFAVAIGLASQHALSNVVSGVFIIVFKPFRVNQRIRMRDTLVGTVEDITLRHVIIKDFENRRIIIPNSVISQEVIINADIEDVKICRWVEFNISFDSDIDNAKQIMAEEVAAHKFYIDTRTPEQIEEGMPLVLVRVVEVGAYFVKLRAWAWSNNSPEAFEMGCDLFESIKKRFDAEGVIIPVPTQYIQMGKDKSPQ